MSLDPEKFTLAVVAEVALTEWRFGAEASRVRAGISIHCTPILGLPMDVSVLIQASPKGEVFVPLLSWPMVRSPSPSTRKVPMASSAPKEKFAVPSQEA